MEVRSCSPEVTSEVTLLVVQHMCTNQSSIHPQAFIPHLGVTGVNVGVQLPHMKTSCSYFSVYAATIILLPVSQRDSLSFSLHSFAAVSGVSEYLVPLHWDCFPVTYTQSHRTTLLLCSFQPTDDVMVF